MSNIDTPRTEPAVDPKDVPAAPGATPGVAPSAATATSPRADAAVATATSPRADAAVATATSPRADAAADNAWRRFFFMQDELREASVNVFGPGHPAWQHFVLARRLLSSFDLLFPFGEMIDGAARLLRDAAVLALKASIVWAGTGGVASDVVDAARASDPMAWWGQYVETRAGAQWLAHESVSQAALVKEALAAVSVDRELDPVLGRTRLTALRGFVGMLMGELEHDANKVRRVRWVRCTRMGAAGAAVLALLFGIGWGTGLIRPLPNLAFGKPVKASSMYAPEPYPPALLVDGNRDDLGVHTLEDESPSITIDLLEAKTIRRVVVVNRHDLRERAVPLVIETSLDDRSYTQFARKDQSFGVWKAEHEPLTARFVRLRVARKSFLHLNEVEVY